MVETQFYIPHLEWEAIEFPLRIQHLKFEKTNYGFDDDTFITIWREANLHLIGKLIGRTKTPKISDQRQLIGKGNIIESEEIKGIDSEGNSVVLKGCALDSFKTNSWTRNEIGFLLEVDFILDEAYIYFTQKKRFDSGKPHIHFEWFLCSNIEAHFSGETFRNLKLPSKKVRVGIDEFDNSIQNYIGGSASKDFILIDTPELKCLVAKVPDAFTPVGMEGLCFEFRTEIADEAEKQVLSDLEHFFSFLLGVELYYMGYSNIRDGSLVEVHMANLRIPSKVPLAMPPLRYNFQYEWGNIALLANKLIPFYLHLQKKLSLNQAIQRFWIANELPIGTNLPLLASTVEIVANQYLKMVDDNQSEYLSKESYENIIHDEIESLKIKLSSIDGGNIILNKITGAYKKGVNEKIQHFFSLLGLKTDKAEKQAMNLRNKMAHGIRDYSDESRSYDDIVLTRVYQVLFNRIILRLLNYDGYYIDYSIVKCPSRPMHSKDET